MTVDQFIAKLQDLSPAARAKDIKIIAPNGLLLDPAIKCMMYGHTLSYMLLTYNDY